jgi:hypothetical protein
MSVVECDVPGHRALGKDLIERIDFRDTYRVPLSRSDLSVVEIFFAIFARRPGWMNSCGLERQSGTGASARRRIRRSLRSRNRDAQGRPPAG